MFRGMHYQIKVKRTIHCCGRWMDPGKLYKSWQTKLTSRPICIAQNRQFLHSFFKKLGIVFPERLPGTKSGRTSDISINRNRLLKIILWPIWDKLQWLNLLTSKKRFHTCALTHVTHVMSQLHTPNTLLYFSVTHGSNNSTLHH